MSNKIIKRRIVFPAIKKRDIHMKLKISNVFLSRDRILSPGCRLRRTAPLYLYGYINLAVKYIDDDLSDMRAKVLRFMKVRMNSFSHQNEMSINRFWVETIDFVQFVFSDILRRWREPMPFLDSWRKLHNTAPFLHGIGTRFFKLFWAMVATSAEMNTVVVRSHFFRIFDDQRRASGSGLLCCELNVVNLHRIRYFVVIHPRLPVHWQLML